MHTPIAYRMLGFHPIQTTVEAEERGLNASARIGIGTFSLWIPRAVCKHLTLSVITSI